MANRVEIDVEKIIEEIIGAQSDIELVDVEYVKEHDWYLRIFIDKIGGVDLDDCQKFSEKIDKILDEKLCVDHPYILEVSSPGLDRVLKKARDFIREKDKTVDVSFYEPFNGTKSLTGVLRGYNGKLLKLENLEPIPMEKIAQVRLHVDF